MEGHFLTSFFSPQGIAVFGASSQEDSVGGVVFSNLASGPFPGNLIPINPKYERVGIFPCYKNIKVVQEPVDLAVIATPAETIPEILEACGSKGIKAAVVLSAGFRETGESGKKLEEELLRIAWRHGIRMIGPNTLGILRPAAKLNATFYRGKIKAGDLALISQSGALCTSILDWAQTHDIGFSLLASLGSTADVDFGDVLDFLTWDPQTRAILLYMEGIQKPRIFMSALRAAARIKPIFALKVGKYAAGSRAAISHTGALVGSDEVFDAAFARAGVVRVNSEAQLFAAAATMAAKKYCKKDPLVILTNGGGPGVLAADVASNLKIPLAEFSQETSQALAKILPPHASRENPVDLLGDATPQRYEAALKICLEDPGVGGIVVILTPQAMTHPLGVAEMVVRHAKQTDKPLIACWMGGAQVQAARESLIKAEVPCFDSPQAAVEAYSFLVSFRTNQEILLQTPGPLSDAAPADIQGARLLVQNAPRKPAMVLDGVGSKALISAFHIPTTMAVPARSPNEALVLAEELGFPVAMKILSPDITHKTEVEGVELNIRDGYTVRSAYNRLIERVKKFKPEANIQGVTVEKMVIRPHGREISIGVIRDAIFGPVISFGLGGTLVEVLKDHAVALPPLNERIVHHMISRTHGARYLQHFRNFPPARLTDVVNILLRVSEMACEIPEIKEMDLNPVVVDENGAVVVDARVILDTSQPYLKPYGHLAIHPYPSALVRKWQASDGTEVWIRPIRPEDAQIEKSFVDHLSPQTRYFRFLTTVKELTQAMLVRFTQMDYDREMAFIAVVGKKPLEKEIAAGHYMTFPDGKTCEFGIVVADEWQSRGVGHQIMLDLIRTAGSKGLKKMIGYIFNENEAMIRMVKGLGFAVKALPGEREISEAIKVLAS